MSYPLTQLGGSAFNHTHSPTQSSSTEAEYDRLRSLARQEASKRSSCLAQAHEAYTHSNGSAAHTLSEEGKRHGAQMAAYNTQASEYIFRANNAPGHIASDTIDLHGQFVEEAEEILERRIRAARQGGEGHLHVIVGKGIHSADHVQKIKPRVESVCRELGLQFTTEENAGRIYIDLRGGGGQQGQGMQQQGMVGGGVGGYQGQHGGGQQHPHQQQQHYGGQHPQQHYGGQQQHQQQQQQDQNAEIEAQVKKYLPRILRRLERSCCTIM